MKFLKELSIGFIFVLLVSSCATKKKKADQEYGKVKEVYHNMSSKYNGYWNAEEMMKKAHLTLDAQHQSDYTEILEMYPYTDVENASVIAGDMDIVMKKMARIVKIHPKSDWIDDTYVMLGKAQFLKQDYETAEETFLYFEEEFNPDDPKSRLYVQNKNKRAANEAKKKEKQKEKQMERKIKDENMKKAKKDKAETREDKLDAKDEKRKEIDSYKKSIKKIKDNLRKATKDRKEKEKKAREKARKQKKRVKKDPNADPRSAKEIQLESSLAAKEKAYADFLSGETAKAEAKDLEEEKQKELAEANKDEEGNEKDAGKKKEKRKKISHEDPKGLFKGKLAFHEGVFWLARTYIERENYFSADFLFRQLENEYPTKKEVREIIPAARAHSYLRQKEYDKAVPYLEQAITNEKDKSLKARYAYILGQIHQKQGRESEARMAFKKVDKFKPGYDLKFNSKLNLVRAQWKSGQISKPVAVRNLEKMLKDKKNSDFQDQIHFTIGDIHEKDNDIDAAVASYQNSIQTNVGNKKQKVESYYRIARLLYDKERYVLSSAYYDSTLTVIDKEDDRYYEVKEYGNSLKDIAKNISIINLQDSLLDLSMKSPDELRKILEEMVDEQELAAEAGQSSGQAQTFIDRRNGFGKSSSSFFAWDETLVIAGQKIFERKWGSRSLSDNWRRSNRLGAMDLDIEEEEVVDNSEDLKEEAIASLLATVPTNPQQKAQVNSRREQALFDLGLLFKNKINNNEKCVETLTTLLQDYPKTKHEPEALFYLYLANEELGNNSLANANKSKLIEKYPNAKFSRSIVDPNYVKNLEKELNSTEQFYVETYDQFQNGSHSEVLKRVDDAFAKLEKSHPLLPKFALLQAMSVGRINGKEEYISSLQKLIARYPNTKEETRAKEILRFVRGDQNAFDSRLFDEASEDFTRDDDKLHYIIVVIHDWSEDKLQNAKIKISDYNKKYHQLDKLRISDLPLNKDDETQLILVRKFRNKDKAMKYYNGTLKNSENFLDPNAVGFDIFAATQKNYREIAKKKGVADYRGFFEKYYLQETPVDKN